MSAARTLSRAQEEKRLGCSYSPRSSKLRVSSESYLPTVRKIETSQLAQVLKILLRCLKTYVVSTAVGGKMSTHATILEECGSVMPDTAKARTSEQLEHALEVLLDLSISV